MTARGARTRGVRPPARTSGLSAAGYAFVLVACGATRSAPLLPECAGEGEEGAVATALRAFLASPDGQTLEDSTALFSPVLSCRIPTEHGALALSRDGGGSARQPFVLSCWVRGGPEDGQCLHFGHARGLAAPISPPAPDGAHDFERSWSLWTQSFEGDAVVVVTLGWTAQGYQGVVVRRDGVWEVAFLDLRWVF